MTNFKIFDIILSLGLLDNTLAIKYVDIRMNVGKKKNSKYIVLSYRKLLEKTKHTIEILNKNTKRNTELDNKCKEAVTLTIMLS